MNHSSPSSILITGASSGIGAALALEYAGPQTMLFLSGRNEERLQDVSAQCRARGALARSKVIDVTDQQAMQQWITACDTEFPLDLVIANAGISSGVGKSNPDNPDDEAIARHVHDVNVNGVYNTVLPAIPFMQARSKGQIAIMSSLAGLVELPSAPAYSASKIVVREYGENLRHRLAADSIGVSVIMPGFVESRITAQNNFRMPMLMTAEKAAGIIRLGLEKNQARIAFPLPMYAMMRTLAALPKPLCRTILNSLPRKG